jgi:hypothetical protein
MGGFSVLFLIFGTCVLLVGLYMYTGHKLTIIEWKAAFQNLSIDEWKNIGKWTMISSILIYVLAVLGIIFHWE